MKKLFAIIVLIILFIVPSVHAEDFKFIPANTANIMNTVKELKYNSNLCIDIFGYAETLTKDNDTELIDEILKVRECYFDAGIKNIRITIGLGNKGGLMEDKFKFKKDGVYIRLCSE